MSGRRSKKNQRLGSSRRGPKGLKNTEQDKDDDDDGLQQIAESGDGQNEFHTTTDYHSAQFDHPTSVLECPPHASIHKDSLMETELPERKRKMGSTRKSPGGFKVERKLDEVRSTEDLDEYLTQPNTSATEEHSSLTEDKQSRSSSFPSNLSLQTESSGLGGEPRATLMVLVPENEEKDAIHHREITSHSYEVVNDTHIDKAVGGSVHSSAATVAESDLLREDSGVFNELKTLSHQETPLASTSGQKRRMGSTRRPRSENVGVQEHLRSMTDNERKAEVIDEEKFSMSEEMAQMWDDVARDDPSSHTESPLVSHLSLLAELKEAGVSAGTEAKNQSVAFPLVDPEKALHETSSHYGSQLLNKGLDFKFSSHTENYDVLSKVLEDAGSHLSDNNQHVPDARNDTNTSHDCRDVNTVEGKEEVLKQKEEPSRNKKTSSLSPRQDAQFEERVLNSEESPSQSQHNNLYCSTAQLIEGGNRGFDVLASNISHAEPTATNSPHKISDAVEESQEIYMEIKHENDVCDVASITCDTDLECVDEDQIGSEKDNGFEMKDQGGARDHSVTQIIMEVRDNKEDGGMSTETLWISHQESCDVSTEKEELHREQEYSSTMSHTQSGPSQNNNGKMLEIKEVREDKGETENTVINYMTSKSEEMLSFEDSATETGSHAHQRQFKQSPDKEDYDFSESRYEESEKEGLFSSAESENTAFDRSVGRREKTEGIEGMDTAVLLLDVEKPLTNVNTACNDSKSDLQTENPEQNRVLTEEQNYTSPDTNLEAFQVSDNISAVIDSNLILHIAVGSEETDTVAEESNISFVIPEDSQDSYKLTTFHSEIQENEGDAEIVPVEGDKNLEIQTQNKTFHSSTSEALGTEENIHDVSVLVKEFDNYGDTVTVECNRTTELDFLQTSSETLKVYENPENELSSDINISPECSHREEAHSKSSPIVHKRKMGSTRRPFKGNKGKDRKYHEENETLDSEAMINVEKKTFSLEYEPSPDESSLQISKDGAEEQEKKICEKNDVGPVEGSESDLMQSSFNPDLMSEESTAVTVCHITESQTLTKMNEEPQENTGDAERVPAEGDTDSHSEIQTENKLSDLATSAAERTEENICEDTVLVGEVEFIVDTVTVENNMTIESELPQNDAFTDAKLEALKVSENTANVSSVTDTGLVVQDDSPEGSGDTDTIPDQSDTNIIPKDTHIEEAHSKSSPIVQKRKMGSTRRPLKGNKGKDRKYHDENETLDSESMINVDKKTFSLEYEPNPDESSLQISKDRAEEQEKEICEKNDVGPVEGSESDLMQSSFNPDLMSEESTAVTVCHITESQTITKMNEEPQENTGDAERVPAEGDTDSHSEIQTENKLSELATSAAERTEENICEDTVLVREVEFIVDTVTVENNMTIESEFLQNDAFTDAKLEALKVSENTANVSSVTDTGLVVQDDSPEGSGDTDTIPDQSDTNIIPEDTHIEEAHSKSSPIVLKRKMGSTRRPLKGNKGKDRKYHEENETLDSEAMINVEKETFSLEYEPSPDESSLQISKDGAEEQEKEICEKNDVGPVEGSESDLMQSSFNPDLMSEESTAVTVCHITESQTITKMNEESQENTGDAERVPAEGDTDSQSEIQTENKLSDLATSAAERTEENICEDTVLVGEVEFIVDTVTVENNMTIESEFLQNDAFTDAKLEALKVSENTGNVSSVTDTGLVVQDDSPEGSGDTDTIPDQSDTNIIPKDTHIEEAHSKSSPIVQKRKMGSTRRPLKGNKGKDRKYHDENETLDSESMINVDKKTFTLEYEPNPDESSLQISKNGAEELKKEICEKNDVGPVEGSESDLMQSSFNPDLMSEESTAVTVCHITESQTLTKMNEEPQENTGDAERVPAEGDTDSHSEIQTENKLSELATSAAERTEENICEDTVLVGEVEFIVDTVTVENNMTIESEFLQNDAFTDAKLEALKVSENTANVSSVTDTGLVVQDDSPEGSGDTDTIPDQSDTNIIPKDTHIEEAHSKSSPIVHKRKMGSTRRPLKGNKGKDRKYHEENETLDSEAMINVEKETFSLEYEPSPDESSLQISKDGAEEQEKEICEKNDVGPVEGSESDLMQSSFNPDLMSEESTAVTVCHITESQTLTKMNEESQENTGDAERVPAEGDTDSHSEIQTENKLSDLATSAAERTEENICEDTVLVGEVEFIVDTVTVENNMTIESEFLQNDAFTDAKLEALKVSENTANVSSVTDTGLVVQDDSPEGSGDTDTIPDQSDTNIIPKDTHIEEAHSKSSPIVHKRKMGSTRRPLKGNKGKDRKYHEENETPDSEAMINVEKETFSLEYEPSPDESSLQISKDGAEEQEKEICEKNHVGPVEGSESDLMQSSFNPDLMSEESTAVTVCHITESQTLTKMNEESQENTGDAERVPAEGDTDSHSEIQTENKLSDLATSAAERTEENICDDTVLVREVEFIVDTVTVENNMTIESEFLQNDVFTDAKLEALKVSENTGNVSSVTDIGLVVQDDSPEGSGDTDTIPDQSDTNIIPKDTHIEEAHSKSSPIVHKRKMGSTRRPLKGNKGKDRKYHEENETLDSEAMINVEKETFSLEYEPSPDESSLQISKDGAEEQEKEICEKNDVGPVEGSESDLMQSSFNPDLMSEESTAVTVCHITESQTLTKMNEESQENTGDAERVPAEGDTDTHSEIQTENKLSDLATSAAERTEENICEDTVLVGEVEFIVDTVTVENNMTIESELRQNDAFTDAKLEALKVSENTGNVSSVTDIGLVVQDDSPEGSGDTDTIPDQSDTNIIPKDTHIEEAHSKSSPIVHKRKMGSTRRPLKGNKVKDRKYHEENETLDSEAMINVEKETFSLEYEPSPDESSLQISKDGAEERKKEICEKNDVGPVEGSESDLMQSSFNPDLMSEESTAVTVCHITESQTITKMNEEPQENTGDAERVPAEGDTDSHSEIQTENTMSDLATSAAERTEENICEDTVLVGEVKFIVDTVTVENNMTIESEFLQNDAFTDAKLEALKISENTVNVSSVTDTGLVVQDDSPEGSGDTDTIPDQSDTNIIPKDTHIEEAHSKSSPIVHKRKMGSTRRPLKGNKGKDRKYHEENETLDSEAMINVEKETFSLEYEPSPDESSLQISKDGAEEQEKEICEKNDVGPVEGSESDLMQSSFNPDLMSEESTAVTVCHITESQTLTKMNEESQENTGDAERVPAEGDTDSHSEIQTENKLSDLATSAAERTEENICEDTVLVGEVEFIVDTVTVENNMTIESELRQNDAFTDAKLEALKVSENTGNVSSVTDIGLVVQDDSPEGSGDTDTIPDQSDTNIIPKDTHIEEAHSKSSPIVHKRTMGSTRRPLKGNKVKDRKYHEENETLDSEAMINVEKETFSLEYEPSPDESSLQISKDGAEERKKEICEKNDVGPVEGSESDLMQSSFNPDLMSEESTAVTVCHFTESQTITKMNEEPQENTGDAERVPAEGDTDSHSEIQTENTMSDLATSAAERTEENICEDTVLVGEVEFIVDTVTVENNMTIESEFLQNDAFTDAKLEALKISENTVNVSSVTDTGLVVQDDSPEGSGDTDTIPDQSDTNIIPKDTHIEEAHSKSSPIVHKRKMGSTRRPLKGNKGQRKGIKYDENETLDSESMINVDKKTFSFEYEPNPDESSLQISKDGAEELKKEICEKNDVGPVEGSESDLMQSSFNPDLMSEESTAVTVCHNTESQTITKMNEEPQENTGDAERVPAEGDTDSHSEIQTENTMSDLATSAAERTEENICEDTVLVGEVEFIVDTVTVENNMTIESEFLQNDAFTDAKLEALKISENTVNVSSVTDTGLVVQDDSPDGSGDTDTIPDQSDTNIIPKDTHIEEAHSKSSPIVHKRKMGSTRRPLKGNKGQRKGIKYDENETLHSESMINVDKKTFSLEYEPNPDESSLQISKDEAEELKKEICEKTDVGPVEGSELNLMQSSFNPDLMSEGSTAVTFFHITESQTLTKMNEESQENTGDAEIVSAEGDTDSMIGLTSAAERTEENICEAHVLVKKDEVIGDTVRVDSDMTTEFDFHQNVSSTDAHVEELNLSGNVENKVSRETEKITESNDINIVPGGFHGGEVHPKVSPVLHKRKMGSTRRPLRGDRGQRKVRDYPDENETFNSENIINVEKGTFSLEDQPSPDESTTQSSKDAQNLTDVKLEALKVSENTENVCSVTDTGFLVQEDTPKGYSDMTTESAFPQNAFSSDAHMEEIDTIIEPSGINIIPEDTHREEAHSKLTPVVHKRKMGSTRRPLSGNKGQRKVRVKVSGEEDTETLSEIQDQDNVADHNVTQEIMKIRDVRDEERMNTKPVGMSVQLCDNLEQEQRSDISQTKTGESQDDTGSHLLEIPERTTDFISDIHPSHSDLDLSDALLIEETQIHVSSEDVVMGDTCEPPTEVVETHSVSNRSLQKRKMGSTRKRGNRMVNEEEVEEKEGEAENTTIDDGTTKSEKKLTVEEAIAGSPVHQQPFISCAGKEGHDIQDVASKSDVQTENSDESDQNQSAEMVSGLPLGDVETHSVPEQSEIIRIVTEEFQRKDVQSNSTPVIQKRKMGSTRKTLRGNKGQRREVESKKMDEESKGMAKEQDTYPHLATIEGENKLDEDVEQNFPVEFSHQAAISNMFSESEDGVKEVSLNIHAPSEVCEEKRMENINNSLNDAIDVYEGTKDKFVLTVSREDVPQTISADYLDQHVHGGSEAEQIAIMCHAIPTQELKITQDDVQHENSSQKILSTKEKKRKMGSTRRNPREMRRENMGDQDDILGMAMDRETKKAEDDLDDMPLASSIIHPKEMSSEAVINTDLESEMLVCATDLKAGENDYLNNSDRSEPTGSGIPEHTLQICENQLVNVDVTKHLEPETVTIEKRRKMGSTRKNLREGRTRGKRDAYEDTETADTHLQMSQDSEMSLVGKSVGEQTIHNYSDQSEDSLLIEIERALKKTSQSSSNYEMNVNEPNSGDSANTPDLNKLENSEIKSLQLQLSQISKTHSEPNSPERRRRKMGSTRKNPRQQLKAEREDEDKEDGEIEKNLETNKQELKDLERVEVSVVHNIPENKLNKEYLDVPSAHTSGSQLEESGNPVVQERTSPSTKRKFGSRRTNKGKQGFGKLDASDSRSDLEDGDHKPNSSQVEDNLHNDLTVCDQPISQPIFEQRNMETRNEESAPKGTGAGLVSLDQIINPDRSTVTRQTINLKNKSSEVQFNVVMVGNSCVGKTSFVRRFHEGQFTQDYRSTIGVDTCVQTVALPEKTVKLQLWDTAGQERFHSITTHVFHKADGLLLMYEITCSKSFISVRDWISQARERAPDDAIMILLGNKNDSVEREVQVEEGEDLAREYNILFMECSAATGANVSESMRTLAELLVQRKTRKEEHTKLRREPPPKKSGCC